MGARKGTVEDELVPKDTLKQRITLGRFNFCVRKSKPCVSAGILWFNKLLEG